MAHAELNSTINTLYRAIENGDRDGVASCVAPQLRVEGMMDGQWAVWNRDSYLDRVEPFRRWLGEAPTGRCIGIRQHGAHAVVAGRLSWSKGVFVDTLVFARDEEKWTLRHKTFRELAPTQAPVELYTASGPNGYKISIALEELAIPYVVRPVDLAVGEQFMAPLETLNPNHKVPVLVDKDAGETIFESNAILLYLAQQHGRLLPASEVAQREAIQWLFFQSASLGPMLGQRGHFEAVADEKIPYAIARYQREGERLYDVLETRLRSRSWILTDYSIVDISCFTWLYCAAGYGLGFGSARPALRRWFDRVAARDAVQRGLRVPTPFSSSQ